MSNSIVILKTCKKCQKQLPHSKFRKQSSNKDGLKNVCKPCDDIIAKSYYEKNKSKRLEQIKNWNLKNKHKTSTYKQNYRNKF